MVILFIFYKTMIIFPEREDFSSEEEFNRAYEELMQYIKEMEELGILV